MELEKKYKFCRYVDDYHFYFSDEKELHEAKVNIARILREYNFTINDSKVEIIRYPYDRRLVNIHSELFEEYNSRKEDRFIRMIEKSNALNVSGQIGVYKYLLKILRAKLIPENTWQVVQAHLLSIMMIEPRSAQYISEIFYKNEKLVKKNKKNIEKVINDMLKNNIKVRNEHEVMWILWLSIKLDLLLDNSLLSEVLNYGDDLSIILVVDYMKRKQISDATVINSFNNLIKSMSNQSIDEERWLLLYTLVANGFTNDNVLKNNIAKDNFFNTCFKKGIQFYKMS